MMTLILIGVGAGGCSLARNDAALAKMDDNEVTGTLGLAPVSAPAPTESDLAFARNAASDVLTKGDKDSSQPWENPETGARGSVTPLAQAYSAEDGRTCRDFLASYVNGRAESWLQGAACKSGHGRWEIHTLKPWKRG
jgi:surface antigen